ncbi:unnamed protein product [Macrosiphum euphorbiae]|uniref:ASCH domain-containing protein n=1 Tax=Macrosiphum euphorbiae TaxID=13131 RepID=A0AAV0W4H9_9HEMI|nr:unnamed protein product [Macrosiphum euphorbiae]
MGLKRSFGYSKLKVEVIPPIFKVVVNIKNSTTSPEERISKKTLELIVHYGVFSDEDLEARLEREKYWNEYLHGYYENEKRLFEQNFNYLKRLYEDSQNSIIPDLLSLELKVLKLK